MFRMAWFAGSGTAPVAWNKPWSGHLGKHTWFKPDHHVGLAVALERGHFDYLMIEDGSFITDSYQGKPDYALTNAWAVPKNDPMPIVPLIGQATSQIGIVATITTTFVPPFMAARLGATLDHLTEGRFGFNLVTAHNDRTAQNFGLEQMLDHGLRYEMASEWIDVVDQLWGSWEKDAIVDDRENGMFIDPAKVHPINFEGRFFRCRGPLNTAPGPQGRPVICQAGGSDAGKAFAAKNADTIIAVIADVEEAKNYRLDLDERLRSAGRRPEDIKVFFSASLVLSDTKDEALESRKRLDGLSKADMERRLFEMSFASAIDFSRFDLDAPLPALETNASKSILARLTRQEGVTLRDLATKPHGRGIPFTGTPADVAVEMGEVMKEIRGDGYLINEVPTRRTIAEITDGLSPELQKRGLIRDGYPYPTFRENLASF
jgi:FMN-dependent oxidoreductase (nitrilotriacetate monooxygenase family)